MEGNSTEALAIVVTNGLLAIGSLCPGMTCKP
jgi:hypothetical protein